MVTSRILFTAKQKDELWERWKNGQSVLAISRALERRNKTGVQRIVALNGGIAPAPRCRAVAALKLEEREEISRGIAAGRSVRRIARGLKRSPSTISREIRRNGGSQTYRANRAERSAWERALRPKPCRLALHGELRWRVAQKTGPPLRIRCVRCGLLARRRVFTTSAVGADNSSGCPAADRSTGGRARAYCRNPSHPRSRRGYRASARG